MGHKRTSTYIINIMATALLLLVMISFPGTDADAAVKKSITWDITIENGELSETLTYRRVDYKITSDSGEALAIEMLVFDDESGIYWKDTKEGKKLYKKVGEIDYYINLRGYISLNNDIYCTVENEELESVQYQGFKVMYGMSRATENDWLYFNENGKLQGNVRVHNLFDVDSSGVYIYKESELYNDIKKAEIAWSMYKYDSGNFAKEVKAEGWSDKKIKKYIEDIRKTVEVTYRDYRKSDAVTAILNRTGSTEAGGWASYEDAKSYADYRVTGRWEETKDGKKKYWCDKAVAQMVLAPNYKLISSTPYYVPLEKYDLVSNVVASKQYLTNMGAMIGNKFYAFDKNGILITNRWIKDYPIFEKAGSSYDESYQYVGADGTLVTNAWVKMSGVKRHLNKNGYMDTDKWVAGKSRGYWVNSDGKLDTSRTNEEYKIARKFAEFTKECPQYTEVGVCETFAKRIVKYLFGSKAKGKTYKYSWDKIRVGDTISFINNGYAHIGVVMAKNEERLTLADSNQSGDKLAYYQRNGLYKSLLDENGDKNTKNFEFTTYY